MKAAAIRHHRRVARGCRRSALLRPCASVAVRKVRIMVARELATRIPVRALNASRPIILKATTAPLKKFATIARFFEYSRSNCALRRRTVTGPAYDATMRRGDVICPQCKAGFRRIELASRPGVAGEYRCPLCHYVLEVFDGTTDIAYRLTVAPEKMFE